MYLFTKCLHITYTELATSVNLNRVKLFCLFADQICCDGRPVCVPQQPAARWRSGRHRYPQAGTTECHQMWMAQEARRFCQDVAQSLVCPARGPALLLQRRGGDQSPGKLRTHERLIPTHFEIMASHTADFTDCGVSQ